MEWLGPTTTMMAPWTYSLIEAALAGLLVAGVPPEAAAVEERLRQSDRSLSVTEVTVAPVDLSVYDALLESKEAGDGRAARHHRIHS